MSNPFESPVVVDPPDNTIRNRARVNLYANAAAAISLGLLQFCCNPCFIVTFAAAGSSLNAIRQAKWMKIALDEDYPAEAGLVSTLGGFIGLALVALRVALLLLSIGLATLNS